MVNYRRDDPGRPVDASPGDTDLRPRLAARLRLANARLARRVRQEALSAGDDLTASRLAALATIERLGPITLGELAAVEQVQPPSMTRIVGPARGAPGSSTREVDAADRRDRPRARSPTPAGRLLERSRTRKNAFLAKRVGASQHAGRSALRSPARSPLLEALLDD